MRLIYNISIHLYSYIAILVSPFNNKAKKWVNGQKNIIRKIKNEFKNPEQKNVIWMHVSSLGEFEQGRPLIEKIKHKHPNKLIVLTFFSPSGYEIRKNYEFADFVFYLPNDTKKNAKAFLKIISPNLVFFVKYDIWYNYLNEIKNREIKSYLISAIFRKNQIYFKPYGKWYAKILKTFDIIFVQNKESQNLLKTINISNAIITGDTRFDRVYKIAKNAPENKIVNEFSENNFTIIAGSTWQPDEEKLLDLITKYPKIKLVIAPHQIHNKNINRIKKMFQKFNPILYSDFTNNGNVLIINNIGLLQSIYRYADVTYIGGGFGKGIHNIQEPAAHGKPVIFGPKYHKFTEAVEQCSLQISFSIDTSAQLINIIGKFISDKNYLEQTSAQVLNYVSKNIGSTEKILSKITF